METIEQKSQYCLNCKNKPCSIKGCPLGNQIPDFIKQIKEKNYAKAYEILSTTTVLPGVCGRICPHKKQCEGSCIRAIKQNAVDIGTLEAFAFDEAMKQNESLLKYWKDEIDKNKKVNGQKKVAVIGGGPAGLTASSFLAKNRGTSNNI